MDTFRAWAEIDLDALSHNLIQIRRRAHADVRILLVAKADAYGHGAIAIAKHALGEGVDGIGVTTCGEALELLQAGIRARIVVLGAIWGEEAGEAMAAGVEIGVPSVDLFESIESTARRLNQRARVHLKVDTGMNRLGASPQETLELLARVQGSSCLELAGVMTHIASPVGAYAPETADQLHLFEGLLEEARARNLLEGPEMWIHAANSACLLSGMDPQYDTIRPGIAAYGIVAEPRLGGHELEPLMSVHSTIVHLKRIPPGSAVGYGGTWTAGRPTRLATIPIGYDDGVDWRLGNRGHVLIHGRRAPMVGRISMDYTTVDVTDVPGVQSGDRVTLIGTQGAQTIGMNEFAAAAGTIPYQVSCSIGKRVRRVYSGAAPALAPHPPPEGAGYDVA